MSDETAEAPTNQQRLELICRVDDLKSVGWVIRRDLSRAERLARAGRIFGIFFVVAFLTVFVPILHFILPPLALITGSVLAFGEYSGTGEMLSGEFTCPNCKKVMTLPKETEEWPRTQRCEGCSFTLTLEPVPKSGHS